MPEVPAGTRVRDLSLIQRDIQSILIRKLPGDQDVAAAWAAFCEASRLVAESDAVLARDDQDDTMSMYHRFQHHGQRYAGAWIIYRIADAYGVTVNY